MKKVLETLKPYRELILGIMLVGLFVSTVYAFQFEQEKKSDPPDPTTQLNPRTSSTTLKSTAPKESATKQEKTSPRKSSSASQRVNSEKKQVKKIYSSSISKKGEKRTEKAHHQVKLMVGSGPQAGSYQVEFLPGQNGFAIMEQARSDYGLQFTHQTYSFGIFINSIGGLTSDDHHYWSLFHNRQLSSVGISDLYPNHNDSISWQYISF
jgi:hypothetical protein